MLGLGIFEVLIFAIFFIGVLLYAAIDCVRNGSLTPSEKGLWLLAIIFLNPLGGIVYIAIAKAKRTL